MTVKKEGNAQWYKYKHGKITYIFPIITITFVKKVKNYVILGITITYNDTVITLEFFLKKCKNYFSNVIHPNTCE